MKEYPTQLTFSFIEPEPYKKEHEKISVFLTFIFGIFIALVILSFSGHIPSAITIDLPDKITLNLEKPSLVRHDS